MLTTLKQQIALLFEYQINEKLSSSSPVHNSLIALKFSFFFYKHNIS